jgi:hypothetical protein
MDVQTQIMNLLDDVSPTPEQMIAQIDNLTRKLEIAENQKSAYLRQLNEIKDQVRNVRGHIEDIYSMNGEIDDDIKAIADLLEITLTRRVEGTATIEVSFSFDAPLGFDIDTFELAVDISEDSYEIENFDWNEDTIDISCEEV